MTLGPEPDLGIGRWGTGPYDWLLLLPGVSGLRVPARLAMVVYLGLAVLAAFGAAWVLERVRPRLAVALHAVPESGLDPHLGGRLPERTG